VEKYLYLILYFSESKLLFKLTMLSLKSSAMDWEKPHLKHTEVVLLPIQSSTHKQSGITQREQTSILFNADLNFYITTS